MMKIIPKTLIIVLSIIFLLTGSNPVGAQEVLPPQRNYDIYFDDDIKLHMEYSTLFTHEMAKNIRQQMDHAQDVGNINGFVDDPEIDAYEMEMRGQIINELSIGLDGTNASLIEASVEFGNVGKDAYSLTPIYQNFSMIVEWPEVDMTKKSHEFEKMRIESFSSVKVSFSKKWEITKYTGINNSHLSKNKRTVEGDEWEPHRVVVEFKKSSGSDSGLPGFDTGLMFLALSAVVLLLKGQKIVGRGRRS